MRINKFVASATGLSRRSVDQAIAAGRVRVNSHTSSLGDQINDLDKVYLDNKLLLPPSKKMIVLINKPVGYVTSRVGQGSKTIYDLLPNQYHKLKPVGRLDKDSSGVLVMTDDGDLAFELSHPKYGKSKIYKVSINKPLSSEHIAKINKGQLLLDNKPSLMRVKSLSSPSDLEITLKEGKNRQIRRSFELLGYKVTKLERIAFGPYRLDALGHKLWIELVN